MGPNFTMLWPERDLGVSLKKINTLKFYILQKLNTREVEEENKGMWFCDDMIQELSTYTLIKNWVIDIY